jgi:hypothetical protein
VFQTYIVFAVINAFMVPCVYFFYVGITDLHSVHLHQLTLTPQPETAGRSLEEMDDIFHQVHGFKGAFTVVKVARETPRRYGKKGELLIDYDETAEARRVSERRRSSVAAQEADGKKYSAGDHGEKVEDVESGGVFR